VHGIGTCVGLLLKLELGLLDLLDQRSNINT